MCPLFDTINALRSYSSVIRTFRDRATEAVFRRQRSQKFGPEVANRALRKLLMIDASESLDDMRVPPAIGSRSCPVIAAANTAFGSTTNGAYVFGGMGTTHTTSKSWITTLVRWR